MSSLRSLIPELAARSDASLRSLFAARADLWHPPVADFAALAARASSRASLSRAVERLTLPQLQTLQAMVLVTDPEQDKYRTVPELAGVIAGADPDMVSGLVAALHRLALVVAAPPPDQEPDKEDVKNDGGAPRFAALTSVREVLGAHPAGLGRPLRELAAARPQSRHPALELDPAELAGLLAGAPPQALGVLEKFVDSPLGTVSGARRSVSAEAAGANPVDWLLFHGLLVAIDDFHVELPFEVGVLLRRGRIIADFAPAPPAVPVERVKTSVCANAALSAIGSSLRAMTALLGEVSATPVQTLRSGGVGVREVRRLAKTLSTDMAQVCFHLELAAMAHLVTLDPDTSRWRVAPTGWPDRERPEQWLWLASAWLAGDRLPGVVGTGSPAVNALAAEAFRPDAPVLRRLALETVAEVHAEGRRDDATEPVAGPDAVVVRAAWRRPRLAHRLHAVLPGVLAEAERLGVTGSGALTAVGAAVVAGRWDDALDLLDAALPAPVEKVLLQADLTAVAPGFLSPRLAGELALLADAEGQGPATIYRFGAASIRRALDAGRSAESIMAFLVEHAATDIPQPLEYLVRDTAARHGLLTVGSGATFVTSEDTALLAGLLAGDAFAPLAFTALAPTVLVSPAPPRAVAAALRKAGLPPALAADPSRGAGPGAGLGAGLWSGGPARTATRPSRGGEPAPYEAPQAVASVGTTAANGVVLPGNRLAEPDEVGAQLVLLRSKPVLTHGAGEAAPAIVLETLRSAVRHRRAVRLTTASGSGEVETLRLYPLSIAEGRVRAFDPGHDSERIFGIHRIMDVEPEEDA
ncbi:helicase-associated domain-containing protein [Specibacter cremeus]|uniref:helicase-associated domain-containing protein n=1 Tax=Specibacter cremeus TaxID=1629051 RepID=UPI000F7B2B71|nr:helicase-associated domain-containing protein [Specibacter cremeus]